MKLFLLFLLLSTPLVSEENKKIIFLISTPRSLSTGFMRMMQERGDFEIFHEPSTAPFDAVHYKSFYKETFREDCFQSYEEITESIIAESKNANVFIKEISFCFHEYLTKENPLLQKAHFAFLVRKPQDVVLSFYRKNSPVSWIEHLSGYKQLLELFELVADHGGYTPYLFFSEDLGEDPVRSVELFCNYMDIEFKPESLHWEKLEDSFDGKIWRDGKKPEAIRHWHGDAIQSTGFVTLKTVAVDENGVPTFAEIDSLEDRAACVEIYHHLFPYYEALQARWKSLQGSAAE